MKTDLELYKTGSELCSDDADFERYMEVCDKVEKAIRYLESMNYQVKWIE